MRRWWWWWSDGDEQTSTSTYNVWMDPQDENKQEYMEKVNKNGGLCKHPAFNCSQCYWSRFEYSQSCLLHTNLQDDCPSDICTFCRKRRLYALWLTCEWDKRYCLPKTSINSTISHTSLSQAIECWLFRCIDFIRFSFVFPGSSLNHLWIFPPAELFICLGTFFFWNT